MRCSLLCALVLSIFASSAAQADAAGDAFEQQLLALVNQRRVAAGVAPVHAKTGLSTVATQHSQEMSAMNYFSHQSPRPEYATLQLRLSAGSCYDLGAGENILRCEGIAPDRLAKHAVDSWAKSPDHNRNLLDPSFNAMGLGVIRAGKTCYITQVFTKEAVEVLEYSSQPEGSGYRVHVKGHVVSGASDGAMLLDGKRVALWQAAEDGTFVADFQAPAGGTLSVGQTTSPRHWAIETQMPLPAPVATVASRR